MKSKEMRLDYLLASAGETSGCVQTIAVAASVIYSALVKICQVSKSVKS